MSSAFVKFESYPLADDNTTKWCRTINAYSDEVKAVMGPKIQQIEKQILCHSDLSRFFVKPIPVLQRPMHLQDIFGDNPCVIGDFSSFECMHRGPLVQAVFDAFRHVGQYIFNAADVRLLEHLMCGVNHAYYPSIGLHVWVRGTLMSGAPWTSLANCVLSLGVVLWLRLVEKYGCARVEQACEILAVAEGDDTITAGGAYAPHLVDLLGLGETPQQKARLKSNVLPKFSDGDFCGITLSDEGYLFTDPVKTLCNFWYLDIRLRGMRKTKLWGIYRAKALSLYYQYRCCPMVSKFLFHVLRKTRSISVITSELTYHQKHCYEEIGRDKFYMKLDPVWQSYPISARLKFESLYGISPEDQERFELSVDNLAPGSGLWYPPQFESYFTYMESMRASDDFEFVPCETIFPQLREMVGEITPLDWFLFNTEYNEPPCFYKCRHKLPNPRRSDFEYGDPDVSS